jgi:hypothetical protein
MIKLKMHLQSQCAIILALFSLLFFSCSRNNYSAKPWNDQPQQIPGKVQCELYDVGAEGIAFHEMDSVNNGSGKLNPANGTFLNEFRMNEAVDISYTKTGDVDDNNYNFTKPEMGQLYVGWTIPGEWINYTVEVNKSGKYSVSLMYTANGDGTISLSLDNKSLADSIMVPSTHQETDTVAWRQWHHWRLAENIAQVDLKKGLHILTLSTVGNGNMNYDWLDFELAK